VIVRPVGPKAPHFAHHNATSHAYVKWNLGALLQAFRFSNSVSQDVLAAQFEAREMRFAHILTYRFVARQTFVMVMATFEEA
jgi:hypothetical protein